MIRGQDRMVIPIRRREFAFTLCGAAVAWPLAARPQQAVPVIGLLDQRSPEELAGRLRGFRQGLGDAGFVEGQNVTIEYRWAENKTERLPQLVADLVRRRVAVIAATSGTGPTLEAKAATTTIPIVFIVSNDPVKLGLVASLARPDANLTGINFFGSELTAKRFELLRELVPAAARVAVLIDPANADYAETTVREVEAAARGIGLQIQVVTASTVREINSAFATFARERPDALFVGHDPFFNSRRTQLVHLATRYGVPASYSARDFTEAGGLMSYGANIADAWRQAGFYAGRILKGATPAELPVVQSSKFELVINTQAATMLGLTVPPQLLATADEVIE
jgi:putative ABC transport system substrate-binding protein